MSIIRWEEAEKAVVGYCGRVEVARITPEPVWKRDDAPRTLIDRFILSLEIPFDSHRAVFPDVIDAQKEAEFVVGSFKTKAGW